MLTLGLDTALDRCSVALVRGGETLAARSEPMARGHQERLAPLVAELLAEAGVRAAALDRVGVAVGPGSFTGLRVGLAFAKGLGFALDRPVVGVGTLQALAVSAGDDLVAAVVDGGRGQLWVQVLEAGRALMAPDALEPADAAARLAELIGGRPAILAGSAAPRFNDLLPGAQLSPLTAPDPAVVARLAAAASDPVPARPLYLRAPDARLPGGKLAEA